ncbi:hypothetical protein D3C84_724760 [compost metagenome]
MAIRNSVEKTMLVVCQRIRNTKTNSNSIGVSVQNSVWLIWPKLLIDLSKSDRTSPFERVCRRCRGMLSRQSNNDL